MILILLGLLLWSLAHLLPRILTGSGGSHLSTPAKGLIGAATLGGLVLMTLGYRGAAFVNLWFPPDWTVHLNNLLMVAAIALFGAGASKSRLRGRLRHPILLAMLIWAAAHLLVNGDMASVVLFVGLGLWAVAQMLVINVRDPSWTPTPGGTLAGDASLLGITIVAYAVIVAVHYWLGVWPLPG